MKILILLSAALGAALSQTYSPPAYYKVAAYMQSLLDTTADPCQDFYQYACGNYANLYNGTDEDDDFELKTVVILDQLGQAMYQYDPNTATKPVQYPFDQAGTAFDRCMFGTPTYPDQDAKSLMNFINSLGGWPTVQSNNNGPSGGASGLAGAILGTWRLPTLVEARVTQNPTNPSVNSLLLLGSYVPLNYNQTTNVVTPTYPSVQNLELAYGALATKLANMSGVRLDQNQLYKDAKAVANLMVQNMEMTFKYANLNPPPPLTLEGELNYISDLFTTPVTVSDALQSWPHIDFVNLLLNMAPGNTNASDIFKYPFYIGWPDYFDWLDGIFANYDDRTLRNYEMFVFTAAQASFLPSLRDIYLEHMEDQWVQHDRPTTEGFCANTLTAYMPYLMGRIYADMSGLTPNDLANLSEMIGIVLSAWRGMITEVPWMDSYTKPNAYAKIEQVIRNVGWPNWIMDDASLAAYYVQLNVTVDDDAFTSLNKIARWYAWKFYSTLGQPYDRYTWPFSPAVVNAAYFDQYNSISFPAAIMTTPFYNGSFPVFYNYGHIGWVMGHELGHAFDNNGIYFGPYGEYDSSTWADASSQAGFNNMSACVVNEYDQFCEILEGQNYCVNGQQTLGENIADNGGLVASYRAFKAMDQLSGGDYPMPQGFGPISTATTDQLFFLAATQSWCSNIPEDEQIYLLSADVHSPDKFRPRGAIQNMPQFGQAFQCTLGATYYPTTHCHVWVA